MKAKIWILPASVAAYLIGVVVIGCLVPLGYGCASREFVFWAWPGMWHPLLAGIVLAIGLSVFAVPTYYIDEDDDDETEQ